jgi:hypothetical protein
VVALRHQIALLTAGTGEVDAARHQVRDLLHDARAVLGDDAPEVAEIQALLAHLNRLGATG